MVFLSGSSGQLLDAAGGLLTAQGPDIPIIARAESFLLADRISSASGITYAVNRPTKYSGNPVFGSTSNTWDRDITYIDTFYDILWPYSSRYRMLYMGRSNESTPRYCICYACSSDGLIWVKPIVGNVSYGGNTNNNIVVAMSVQGHGYYNPGGASGQVWLYVIDHLTATDGIFKRRIYGANTPTDTPVLVNSLGDDTDKDIHAIVRRADGKWIVYYQTGFASNTRQIGAYLSSSTDLATCTWADQGVVIPYGGSGTDQKYTVVVRLLGGLIYAFVARYNSTSDHMDRIQLYVSRDDDGLTFTAKDDDWLSEGLSGAWDYGEIFQGAPLLVGTEWWHYYQGETGLEHSPPPDNGYAGIAKIGANRLGQASGAGGTVVTTAFSPVYPRLFVNTNASAGGARLDVELLDGTSGLPLSGYALADSDGIAADGTALEATWGSGARHLPTTYPLKAKFYLTGAAILYGYTEG